MSTHTSIEFPTATCGAVEAENCPWVYILLLNWRGAEDTIECLESVFRLNYPRFRVVVCDNDSGDGSLARIRAWAEGTDPFAPASHHPYWERETTTIAKPIPLLEYDRAAAEAGGNPEGEDEPLVLIQTGANLGFAGGNNVGIRYVLARGDAAYIWLLNNDTIVDPDALSAMVARAESDERIGMVGSKLLYYDQPQVVQAIAGGNVIRWKGLAPLLGNQQRDRGQWDEPLEIDCVIGASLLARVPLVHEVGSLDERYFMYSEEMDWCLRARQSCWRLVYAPGSSVWHKQGRSVGNKSAMQDYHAVRGMLLLVQKFYPQLFPVAFLYSVYRCFLPKLFRRQPDRAKAVLRAYLNFFFGLAR